MCNVGNQVVCQERLGSGDQLDNQSAGERILYLGLKLDFCTFLADKIYDDSML